MTAALAACLVVLTVLGLTERAARDRAWRAVPIRVHVNGSRGKSTVTRLVWSALRAAGIPALAKTTGTQPRLLLPDGSERALRRLAPASIREQLALLRQARRRGAKAVVVECMALDPELQWVSERQMVGATIGVVTNVRRDHEEVMGKALEAVASSLANTIPRGGILVCGEDRWMPNFAERAERLGTRIVSVTSGTHTADTAPGLARWLAEDRATALAVTRSLGIDDETARRGFDLAPPDPGAATSGVLETRDRRLHWLDATAANDPESLAQLVDDVWGAAPASSPMRHLTLVYNHRTDRGPRLSTFIRYAPLMRDADRVILTGARPPLTVSIALGRARALRDTGFVPRRALAEKLQGLPSVAHVVFCGNTRSFDAGAVLREMSVRG